MGQLTDRSREVSTRASKLLSKLPSLSHGSDQLKGKTKEEKQEQNIQWHIPNIDIFEFQTVKCCLFFFILNSALDHRIRRSNAK